MNNRGKYTEIRPVGVARMGGKLYVVAVGVSGGVFSSADTSPAYRLLVATRWHADGSRDDTFHDRGVQEVGYSPHRLDYSPRGLLVRSATELLVYGEAGRVEMVTSVLADGSSRTSPVVRRAEPALFRVADPIGVDTAYGQGGADLLPVHEFEVMATAARLLPPSAAARSRGAWDPASAESVSR